MAWNEFKFAKKNFVNLYYILIDKSELELEL